MSTSHPLPFAAHRIELVCKDGAIEKVNVYPGSAEVTRVYRLDLRPGVNEVKISELPSALDRESLRVEGLGATTIQDVVIAAPTPPSEPDKLSSLLKEKKHIDNAQARCVEASYVIQRLFRHMSLDKLGVDQIGSLMETFERENAKLDERKIDLEEQNKDIARRLEEERRRSARGVAHLPSSLTATISVFAGCEGEAEVLLTYAVRGATWNARYDVRANIQSNEEPVIVVYKATISQSTGESWDNVALTLETVTPTFGLGLPTLEPYHILAGGPSLPDRRSEGPPLPRSSDHTRRYRSAVSPDASERSRSRSYSPRPRIYSPSPHRRSPPQAVHRRRQVPAVAQTLERSPSPLGAMPHRTLGATNFGGLNATYEVPGLISIPSDEEAHNVTIVELELNAQFSWIAIPKVDLKVHLQAIMNNDSEYTLLPGPANIYVDGSFISKINMSVVNPHEDFTCGLGLDPEVRLVYHPLIQKTSQFGFVNRVNVTRYTRRITVHNAKPVPINNVTITDRIPVSTDAQIVVKLVTPPLPPPLPPVHPNVDSVTGSARSDSKPLIEVGEGVLATWDAVGADAGRDGKLNWLCSIPPQGRVSMILIWEETCPANAHMRAVF